jgi:hypothetical protein
MPRTLPLWEIFTGATETDWVVPAEGLEPATPDYKSENTRLPDTGHTMVQWSLKAELEAERQLSA